MLRCQLCGGRAHPALAHLHGMTEPHCYDCTQRILSKRKEQELVDQFLDSWKREAGIPVVPRNKAA